MPEVSGIARMNLAAMDTPDLAVLRNTMILAEQFGQPEAEQMRWAIEDELRSRGCTWGDDDA